MSSAQNSWGTLINSDKSPAPLLEQLCLSIAQVMPTFDTNGTGDITPERMAAFYRKVGGNYDPLFLETKTQALSFIYQSLGCFHSLQPSANPYEPPTIPSLLPTGFVRWQTIQLLMDPDEHSVYLQNAVSQWDLVGANGDPLPKEIPRDAFPSEPDPEMLEWHEGVSRRLEHDYLKRHTKRASPPDFGTYHYHFSGKDPLPDEDDYFSKASRRTSSKQHSHAEPDRSSGHRHHRRHHSGQYPPVSGHRKSKARTGFSTPRVSSPPPWGDRPHRPRGRDQAPGYGHPLSPGTADEPEVFEASSDEFPKSDERPKHHRHREKRHLSPPSNGHARRHSHDAYTRRPFRDLSPGPQRQRRSHESHSSRSSKSHPETSPRHKDRSRSRTAGVKFRDFIFGDSAAAPAAPSPPLYRFHSPPPRAVPRHLDPYAADDTRRGSYSGGSSGSRPSSGGSGSERPRSYSSAGMHRPNNGWSSPRTSAAKRYTPVPEEYVPSRRVPIYER
ncbi:uncharacterized protein N7506_008314 [Penicillium brevicompactum]|uniref:uncharacterized protein n=1 Tax=Penicillium brevicompactum TaxID=5074 RepID=UPI00253F9B96|nr:uncharacterized protein N7506_008314 [Penicillium brevicompactum]KAJ5325212.1 hypothetical protein N7506_008314 [Penicillium brevicompactum]